MVSPIFPVLSSFVSHRPVPPPLFRSPPIWFLVILSCHGSASLVRPKYCTCHATYAWLLSYNICLCGWSVNCHGVGTKMVFLFSWELPVFVDSIIISIYAMLFFFLLEVHAQATPAAGARQQCTLYSYRTKSKFQGSVFTPATRWFECPGFTFVLHISWIFTLFLRIKLKTHTHTCTFSHCYGSTHTNPVRMSNSYMHVHSPLRKQVHKPCPYEHLRKTKTADLEIIKSP